MVEAINENEKSRRQSILDDASRMMHHVTPELMVKLDEIVAADPEAKTALIELIMFSIQFGRTLQRAEHAKGQIHEMHMENLKPSATAANEFGGLKLVSGAGSDLTHTLLGRLK